MKDNEIINALECCAERISCDQHCPYWRNSKGCDYVKVKVILDLINRQRAEIERLEDLNKCYYTSCQQIAKSNHEIKAEAVKEFLRKQEIELANNTDISAVGYQSVIELNIKILKEMGIE